LFTHHKPLLMANATLTAVSGLVVGHAQDAVARTGCTVVIGPFRAAAYVPGFATGTRELDVLSPSHLAHPIDALLLTGGSAFGLGAADGVVRWLEQRGRGFATPAGRVPIVPAAVIFDLGVGNPARRPDADMGFAACEAATAEPMREGAVGAGTGATVGKLLGMEGACPSGIGSWSVQAAGYQIGALAVVNALGDVLSHSGDVLAGARSADGRFIETMRWLRTHHTPVAQPEGGNTTLAVVATDAPLTRLDLYALARQSANALARRIAPVFTPFDGDIVFALSTAGGTREFEPGLRLQLSAVAQYVLEIAIERAVTVVSGMETVSRRSESP
jgi:L-aminopeptidase/D-esterase-like protein